jgi:hypothetical protein
MSTIHCSNVKPLLTPENKQAQLQAINANTSCFDGGYDQIDVDEKWFRLMKVNGWFHLVPGEKVPDQFAKSRNYIPKAMFF